jgi:hypothetical protein
MVRWIATLLMVTLLGWIGAVAAQQTPVPAAPPTGQAPAATPPVAGEKVAEGKLKAVDQPKKQITLEDGTMFTIPTSVQVSWAELQPGKTVAVSYTEAGQQKSVKKVEVK